mmetsp:Transcript_17079/g.20562  ORF Transcript_17079/g.20562 Transcript_17079/m.20562 type:complete len:318 (-) Transcript_17079:784-1737(-)
MLVRVWLFVDRQLPLVGGVELDLKDLGVPCAESFLVLKRLGKLDNTRLRGITSAVNIEEVEVSLVCVRLHVAEDFTIHSNSQELSIVAERGNHEKLLESGVLAVVVRFQSLLFHQLLQVDGVFGCWGSERLEIVPAVLHSHTILGQCSGLVRANNGGRTKGLHSLQVLHQNLLLRHTLCGQGQGHRDSGEQTLRHVGDNDTDNEDDILDNVGTHTHTDEEKADTQNNSDSGDQVHELLNLLSDWARVVHSLCGKTSDLAHGSAITSSDDNSPQASCGDHGSVEHQVLGLHGLCNEVACHVPCQVGSTVDGLRFSCQR